MDHSEEEQSCLQASNLARNIVTIDSFNCTQGQSCADFTSTVSGGHKAMREDTRLKCCAGKLNPSLCSYKAEIKPQSHTCNHEIR